MAKQGRRAGKYRGHLDVPSLESSCRVQGAHPSLGNQHKKSFISWSSGRRNVPKCTGTANPWKKQKININFSEMIPCQLKNSAGTSSDKGTGEKMGSSSGSERNDKVLEPPTGCQSHPTCTSLSRPWEALRGCSGLILHLKSQV